MINQYSTNPSALEDGRTYCFAKELAKRGHRVALFSSSYHHLSQKPIKQKSAAQEYSKEGIRFIVIRTLEYVKAHSVKRILNWFTFAWRLQSASKLRAETPDIICVSTPSIVSVWGAMRLAKKHKAKLVWDLRDPWPLSLVELKGLSVRHPLVLLLQWFENMACRCADHVISNAPFMLRHLESRGVGSERFTWIPNGFYLENFVNSEALDEDFEKTIPKEKFIVGYTGTLGLANATDVMLDVAEVLLPHSEIAFVVVGGGDSTPAFLDRVRESQLSNVHFLGRVKKSQVPKVLERFDCCYVGFRNNNIYRVGSSLTKLPEYLASQKPIVFSITSPFKPVTDAGAGITVEAEDVSGIANAILSIAGKSASERQEMGLKGLAYAKSNHEYSVLVDRLELTLLDLLKSAH